MEPIQSTDCFEDVIEEVTEEKIEETVEEEAAPANCRPTIIEQPLSNDYRTIFVEQPIIEQPVFRSKISLKQRNASFTSYIP